MTVKDPTTYLRSTPTPQTLRGVISLLKNLYTYESINDVLTLGADLSVPSLLYVGGTTKPAGSPAKLLILETGAVLGTAATGYTQIGHVATDILDITVGAAASGKVRVNNTTTSTSVSTGAIVNAGGQGIAGKLWVGGTANIAGAVTLQSTLAISDTITITRNSTHEYFIGANSAADNKRWLWSAETDGFVGYIVNDALTVFTKWLQVDRTGTTVDSVTFPGTAVAVSGTLTVALGSTLNQTNATGAVPPLTLSQSDIDQDMIEFACTIGTGNGIEAVGAKTLTTTHFVKVTIPGGLTRYFPVGTIA